MIYIGLSGWGDHDSIYPARLNSKNKLAHYSAHFPIVELDSSFYAIPPERNSVKWIKDTPDSFQFIIKAYQGMTGHQRGEIPYESKEEMFDHFKKSIVPYINAGKLAMVLFQFPPWFDCTKDNVAYLRWCREQMGDMPCALEFRHQSWFSPSFLKRTLDFMKKEEWIHSICDEPQAGVGSVPAVLEATSQLKTLVRFHGRNIEGWKKPASGENWREVRYLYRYNKNELTEWKKKLEALQRQTQDIYVIFNNNSGGDAADNGEEMITLLDLKFKGLAPRQLDFFS
ncbi:DUF72 domain-containing protein [Bacillus gobiensis]|uniref:DUF72 domain-containing protein n=1 Tax=Bacillus gobiensis TaxID=1441095 RepID=UPI003D1F5F3E